MEPTRQPGQEKCCAVNKSHVEMEITVCSASVQYLPDTKQPGTINLKNGKWHFMAGTCLSLARGVHKVEFLRDRLHGTKNNS